MGHEDRLPRVASAPLGAISFMPKPFILISSGIDIAPVELKEDQERDVGLQICCS